MSANASRVAARQLEAHGLPLHKAAEADEAIGDAYRGLATLKAAFDAMEEIPSQSMPLYNEIGKAMSTLVSARHSTTQVRELIRRKRF